MDDLMLQEVANEIKGLHNGALRHIKKGEYYEASLQYRKALILTDKIQFHEGMAMTLFSMANLALIVDDLLEAINNAADAKLLFDKVNLPSDHCTKLLNQLALNAKKRGVAFEREGNFSEAIEHFQAAIPFSRDKDKSAMLHEVELLRRIIDAQKPSNS